MKSGLLLNVVVRQSMSIFQLLARKDQSLLVRRNSFLILDLGLYIFYCIPGFNLESDDLPRQSLHENLHLGRGSTADGGSINCGKFLTRCKYQTILPTSWEICIQVKKQQLEPDMEQWTGSKLGKEYIKPVYCHLTYLTYMQRKIMWNGWSTSWNKTAGININNLRYADDTTLMTESEEELRSLLMKVKEESERSDLKLNIQKTKIMASSHIIAWQIDGDKNGNSDRLYFLGLQIQYGQRLQSGN